MNKAELIDAIASGSKLTKADAGRLFGGSNPTNPNPRAALGKIAALWNQLTQNEQQSWNDAAPNFPQKNKYGDIYIGSGYQVFMQLNTTLFTCNMPLLRSGPIADFPVLPPVEPPSGDPPELLRFGFTGGIPTNMVVMVFACNQVQKGSGFVKGKRKLLGIAGKLTKADAGRGLDATIESIKRLIHDCDTMFPNPWIYIDATGLYQNIFGQVKPKALIYFEFVPVNVETGQQGISVQVPVNVPDYIAAPRLYKFIDDIYNPNVPANEDWITPFRAQGFNLTGNMTISCPVDPADNFLIGRTKDGPWVHTLNVPLNELKQPIQNVFYIKQSFAAAGVGGTLLTVSSPGATDVTIGIGVEVVAQVLTGAPNPFGFGDVYSGLYTIKQMNLSYVGMRTNIDVNVTGPNADLIQIAEDPAGPWGSELKILVPLVQTGPKPPIYARVIPGDTGALVASINLISAGDITTNIPVSANVVHGELTSPESGGIAYGDAISGERNEGTFSLSGVGLSTGTAINASSLVNCDIEFCETFGGIYSNPKSLTVPHPTFGPVTIYYNIIPTALGAFSGDIGVFAGGADPLTISFSGTSV